MKPQRDIEYELLGKSIHIHLDEFGFALSPAGSSKEFR